MSIPSYSTPPRQNSKALAGLILVAVGGILLLRQLDLFFFPHWLFTWPVFLIVLGIYIGAKNNFRNVSWFVLVLIGSANLLDDIFPSIDVSDFMWPIGIIAVGIWVILRRNHPTKFGKSKNIKYAPDPIQADYVVKDENFTASDTKEENFTVPPASHPGDDYIEATAVFGSVKKVILSKDFKGGVITNIFGGCELDFTKADINGSVIIDITQLFGGVKMLVPSHWQVTSDIAAVFASIDDKRLPNPAAHNSDKILILKGISVFAGIDIRSF
ncbi:cell wall-active antibiotics response protein [Mucilaginibacter robiniae]|uniref:Cell wall-active antibiotics response protein n=1 Tax=Mucilaginibacter robiniae TaxID=2728022 RepID=A0A7L5DVQ6_9SPHI|nr:DUF5668 domain-containing protein [Mucilaginibacter robiniae]QJD95185.1 cell wall-active antibiotics response protein [Mucilaginibacter robiniae]